MSDRKIYQLDIFGERTDVTPAPVRKSRAEKFEDYDAFVEKFTPKLTTDDCYTPPAVYEAVKAWVDREIAPLAGRRILKPFRPGGNYEAEEYLPGDVVLDNPPFSILKKIVDFYMARGVDFFLFSPGVSLFNHVGNGITGVVIYEQITYENGAQVNTGFLTNMERRHAVILSPELDRMIREAQQAVKAANGVKQQRTIRYPDCLVTGAGLRKYVNVGFGFRIPFDECHKIRNVGADRHRIFGSGLLVSPRLTAVLAEMERRRVDEMAIRRITERRRIAEIEKRIELTEAEVAIMRSLEKRE